VAAALGERRPPVVVGLRGTVVGDELSGLTMAVIELADADGLAAVAGQPEAPAARLTADGAPAWVRLAGTLERADGEVRLRTQETTIEIELACSEERQTDALVEGRDIVVVGIAVNGDVQHLIVPCGAIDTLPTLAAAVARPTPAAAHVPPPPPDPEAGSHASLIGVWPLLLAALLALSVVGIVAVRTGAAERLRGHLERWLGDAPTDDGGIPEADQNQAITAANEVAVAEPPPPAARLSLVSELDDLMPHPQPPGSRLP
jgi:citrate lyase gamma subunit